MCQDCICDTLLPAEVVPPPPTPTLPAPCLPTDEERRPEDGRSREWTNWWNERITITASASSHQCVVCSARRKPEEGGSCCGNCGKNLRDSEQTADQFEIVLSKLPQRSSSGWCSHFEKFRLPVPFVCDTCWKALFPCKAETRRDRIDQIKQALRDRHGLDYNTLSVDSLPELSNRSSCCSEIAACLDYDHAVAAFKLCGGQHVPAHGTMVWCPQIRNAAQAADLLAQRVFLRRCRDGKLLQLLEYELGYERLSDYISEMQDAEYDSGSDEEDVRHYENVESMIHFKIRRQILRLEQYLLEKEEGLPNRWPWQDSSSSSADKSHHHQPLRVPILCEYDLVNVPRLNDEKEYGAFSPEEGEMEE